MRSRQEIKAYAKEAFKAQRTNAILALFLVTILTGGVSIVVNIPNFTGAYALGTLGIGFSILMLLSAAVSLLTVVLEVNVCGVFVKVFYGQPITATEPYSELKNGFGRKLGGSFWMVLWFFLWYLLFFIPGIIKLLAYSMTPYVLANHPNVKATDAIKLSMRMTKGHKGKIFVLYLSFIGWNLLSALTFGILGIFFVNPYYNTSLAGFFVELRSLAINNGLIHPSELDGVQSQYGQQPQYPPAQPYMAPPPQQFTSAPPHLAPPYGVPLQPPAPSYNAPPPQYPPAPQQPPAPPYNAPPPPQYPPAPPPPQYPPAPPPQYPPAPPPPPQPPAPPPPQQPPAPPPPQYPPQPPSNGQ